MKKILGLFLTLFLFVALASCTAKSTKDLVAEAKTDLAVVYSNGDSESSVTKKVTLITQGTNEVVITWSSSDTTVIANDGTVTRPAFGAGDKEVTLTATLRLKDVTDTKEFKLTVKETPKTDAEKLAEAKNSLAVSFASGDNKDSVTGNITLPATEGNATVTWSSSNPAVVTNAGVVTRPKFGMGNATVALTATLTLGSETTTKDFVVVVKANENILDEDAVLDTKGKIILLSGETSTTTHFELPVEGQNGTTISWVSSNSDVIEVTNVPKGDGIKARVTRPAVGAEDATVTLTATVSKGEASVTKEFELTVKAYTVAPSPLLTIAEAKAKGDGAIVKIRGVVTEKAGTNAYVQDDSGAIYLYLGSKIVADLVIGNYVEIEGEMDLYNGLFEMKNITTDVISMDNDLPAIPTYYSIAKLMSENTLSTVVTVKGLTITEVKAPTKTGDSYSVIVTDGVTTGEIRIDKYTPPYMAPASFTVGQVIDLTAPVAIFKTTCQLMIVSLDDMTVSNFTDADRMAKANEMVVIPNANQIVSNITLPATVDSVPGTTVTWSSGNTAVIANDGTVTRPALGQPDVDVTLTATITLGSQTVTKDITVKVLAIRPISVADAKTKADAALITIQGIVTELAGNNAYVQDETGAIYLSVGSVANANLVIGNEVQVSGELDIYNNLYQLINISDVTVISTGNALPEVVTYPSITELKAANPLSEIVKLEGLKIVKVNTPSTAGSSYSVVVTDGVTTMEIRVDKYTLPYIESTNFTEGNAITVTAPLGVYNTTYQLMIVSLDDMTNYTLTDADKVKFAKYDVIVPLQTKLNLTLPATSGEVAITWSSDNEAVISSTGTVVRPAAGQPDATVKLTAVYTLNDVTSSVVYTVVVPALVSPDTQFVETFDTNTATTSYADGSFIGVNGVNWVFTHSRDQDIYNIDDKGLMLRRASDSSLTGVFADGVGTFSFEFRKAYTGTSLRQLSITVTDSLGNSQTYTTETFGTVSGADATVLTFTQVLNLAGPVTIKIGVVGTSTTDSTNRQTVIDNITWNGYNG